MHDGYKELTISEATFKFLLTIAVLIIVAVLIHQTYQSFYYDRSLTIVSTTAYSTEDNIDFTDNRRECFMYNSEVMTADDVAQLYAKRFPVEGNGHRDIKAVSGSKNCDGDMKAADMLANY